MRDSQKTVLFPNLVDFLAAREAEQELIPTWRKAELKPLADYVRENLGAAKLTFICTHNSRRSHFSQIWAKVAAEACGIQGVETYSGGTEATAMNPRVVDSLQRSGFRIAIDGPMTENPRYNVYYAETALPIVCFSKRFDQPPNPTGGYCAIMTCSSADNACPIVSGCDLRLPIRYEDPKEADGTPHESAVYDERSRQICREMLFAMRQV
ncbi:MAG: protein-tyrosine-phosphatase [Planctomycetales bacterium]|nr:protein-tyrosine-phosphatase [Planctomycetales bacterium]